MPSHAVGLPQVRSPMGNLRAQGRAFMLSLPRPTVPGSSRLSFRLPAGKDAAAHKATLVGVLGPAAARRRLESLVAEAQTALEGFGSDAGVLRAAARFPKAKAEEAAQRRVTYVG